MLKRKEGLLFCCGAVSAVGIYHLFNADLPVSSESFQRSPLLKHSNLRKPHTFWLPPKRQTHLANLAKTNFDLLIIGGGATGAGTLLDAVTRGLNVALVERDDFASGTSSRSTKLVHGGVRYLEKAFLELDLEQYKLVNEALYERSVFLKIAPYLSYQLPIMLPIYKTWKIPYYWAGSKAYDILAGKEGLSQSYFLSARKALEAFPMLKADGLKGAMVYYDGAHNDSRMNMSLIQTAIKHGATVANHVEVIKLIKKTRQTLLGKFSFGNEEICAAECRDTLTGETFTVKAKGIINATGPFVDGLRKLDEPSTSNIVAPSAGVHIILPGFYSPKHMGLLDPQTSDGRVIFFLPWEGNTIAGTTDSPTEVTSNPIPSESEINWILNEVKNYLNPDIKVRRGDVLAAWSGIRPLVRDPNAKNTEGLVRNHMINVSASGLLTIAGGKWTTYRSMAKDTVDKAIEVFDLDCKIECRTEDTPLIGTHEWSANLFVSLIQHFGLETSVAEHLSNSYGDRSWQLSGQRWPVFGKRLVPYYAYIEAEVRYACQVELAQTASDVLARRTRLAFLNAYAALEALPRVIEIMTEELGWDKKRQKKEYNDTVVFLQGMGLVLDGFGGKGVSPTSDLVTFFTRSHFLSHEMQQYRAEFERSSTQKTGKSYIYRADVEEILQKLGLKMTNSELDIVLKKGQKKRFWQQQPSGVDGNRIEFDEFLDVLAATKEIKSKLKFSNIVYEENREVVDIGRSGGGV